MAQYFMNANQMQDPYYREFFSLVLSQRSSPRLQLRPSKHYKPSSGHKKGSFDVTRDYKSSTSTSSCRSVKWKPANLSLRNRSQLPHTYRRLPAGQIPSKKSAKRRSRPLPISPQPNARIELRSSSDVVERSLRICDRELAAALPGNMQARPSVSADSGASLPSFKENQVLQQDVAVQIDARNDVQLISKEANPAPKHSIAAPSPLRKLFNYVVSGNKTQTRANAGLPAYYDYKPKETNAVSEKQETSLQVDVSEDEQEEHPKTPPLSQEKMMTQQCKNCSEMPELMQRLEKLQNNFESQKQLISQLRSDVHELQRNYDKLERRQQYNDEKISDEQELETKASSICQYCHNKDRTIIDAGLHYEVIEQIDKRKIRNIVLTVLLRADNIYHINIRDLKSGNVLGCLLASDAAIQEAIDVGLFKLFLTFYVIDTRNTLKPRQCTFGLTFEYKHNQSHELERRQLGGRSSTTGEHQALYDKEFAARALGLPESNLWLVLNKVQTVTKALKKNKPKKMKVEGNHWLHGLLQGGCRQQSDSRTSATAKIKDDRIERELASIRKSFVLEDDENAFPVRTLEVTSLSDLDSN